MANYRQVHKAIWSDPDFQEYSSQGKLLFIYLCTNANTTESGLYPITHKTIANETDIPIKTVRELLGNGFKNVSYDCPTKTVFVHRFLKYNGGGRPDLLFKAIQKENERIQSPLWKKFNEVYPFLNGDFKTENLNFYTNSITNSISISIDPLTKGLGTVGKQLKDDSNIIELPDWLPVDNWNEFREHRKELKAKMTPKAEKKAINKLGVLRDKGNDPVKVIDQSIEMGWKGIFPLKEENNGTAQHRSNKEGYSARDTDAVAAKINEELRRDRAEIEAKKKADTQP